MNIVHIKQRHVENENRDTNLETGNQTRKNWIQNYKSYQLFEEKNTHEDDKRSTEVKKRIQKKSSTKTIKNETQQQDIDH